MNHVDYAVRDGIAVLAFSNPPVNGLSHALRAALGDSLGRASADASVRGIVLIGRDGSFSAGADIREFGGPDTLRAPHLRHLTDAVESCSKPVVAAIEGVALGGGFELALACHYRVAKKDAKVGLPEVKLGLLPGAGGTQRLPRLVGVEIALNVAVGGEPVSASQLAVPALFEAVVDDDVLGRAIQVATNAAAKGAPWPRARDRVIDDPNVEGLCQFARNTVRAAFAPFPAPLAIIDAIQAAATKSFDEGLAVEWDGFLRLEATAVSRALRHAFFAERAASKVDDVPASTPTRDIRKVAVIGGGTMGTGIALNFLNVGMPVTLLEVKQDALDRGIAKIRETLEGQVKKGRLKADEAQRRGALLTPTLTYDGIADADLVIEAVFEDMGVKTKVFETLDAKMKAGAILATNTSTLDVDAIANVTKRPQDVVGLHFFSPANIMKLLVIVRGKATGKDVLATTLKVAKTIRKTAVVARVCDGFIGNRMLEQYMRQALFMLDEGASPQQIDAAVEKFGFAMGPFRVSDLAGNDISWAIRKRRYVEKPDVRYSRVADKVCELGRMGQKTGAGWYDYVPGDRNARPSQVVTDLIDAHRKEIGIKPRKVSSQEIVDRLVLALVNEGAALLGEGIAQRASDIDVVYLTGYGFPVWRGGPMQYADELGLYDVVRRMQALATNPQGDPGFWKPAPLLARLAATGSSFSAAEASKSGA